MLVLATFFGLKGLRITRGYKCNEYFTKLTRLQVRKVN